MHDWMAEVRPDVKEEQREEVVQRAFDAVARTQDGMIVAMTLLDMLGWWAPVGGAGPLEGGPGDVLVKLARASTERNIALGIANRFGVGTFRQTARAIVARE